MNPIYNRRKANVSIIYEEKPSILKQIKKTEYCKEYFNTEENKKTISFNTTISKNDNSNNYRISTLPTENNEISKNKYKKLLIPHILKNRDKIKNNIIGIFKSNLFSTKQILRPKTTLKQRFKKKYNIYEEENIEKIFKYYDKNIPKYNHKGVPLSFVNSMRLNIKDNLVKVDIFFAQEKKRLLKENSNLKYHLKYHKLQKQKKEELEKINQFKIWKKYVQVNNKNKLYTNILNEYHSNLLHRENEQYFDYIKPIIDKKQFSSKFRALTEINKNNEQKNNEIQIISNIFGKYLEYNNKIKKGKYKFQKEKTICKGTIYQSFKILIKKCAIEFKNIKISLKEYIKLCYASKNIIKYLFNENYIELIKIIKREKYLDNIQKDKEIINYITRDNFLAHTIDFYGQNIIFLSIKYKLYKSISKLIQFGANINLQDFKGRTALHFAAKYNDISSVIILLYYLANPSIKDNNGKTPFDYVPNSDHDSYIIKDLLIRSEIIKKFNKYRSWKEYDIFIRRGIQYYLNQNLSKEKYHLIFSFIDNAILYYS